MTRHITLGLYPVTFLLVLVGSSWPVQGVWAGAGEMAAPRLRVPERRGPIAGPFASARMRPDAPGFTWNTANLPGRPPGSREAARWHSPHRASWLYLSLVTAR